MRNHSIILLILILAIAPVATTESKADERQLSFYHTHTSESLTVTYFREGQYVPSALERGGVGYYEKSDFVHVDTGRVRQW